MPTKLLPLIIALLLSLQIAGCSDRAWNNPYPAKDATANRIYSSFEERPKHLDPARSYSSNEWSFISQIYEPPLQYHFLKRPYALVPQTAARMPKVERFDAKGRTLPADVPVDQIAYTDYTVDIRPDMTYQPHPALATERSGKLLYWPVPTAIAESARSLADFPKTGTREVVADDFVYQIKRLAYLPNHSPIASLMAKYIEGFSEFAKETSAARKQAVKAGRKSEWLDLRAFDMSGVKVLGPHRYRIRLNSYYPQFIYWLAMNFFAPMPWEAERFYSDPRLSRRNINLNWFPIGTGPYMLTENNPNLRMVLSRNPNFRGEPYPRDGMPGHAEAGLLADAGKTMPFIDQAVYSLEKEAIPRWNKFLQGYYDNSGIGSDAFDQAVKIGAAGDAALTPEMQAKGIKLITAVQTSVYYMGFNMKDPVVGGDSERARLLRRAISIAIDQEEYISIFQNGRGLAAQGPLPEGIYGHKPGRAGINPYVYDWRNGQAVRKSIDEAKALLAKAGYPEGRDPETGSALVLKYDTPSTGAGAKAMLNWYQKQFDKIGIELIIRATDYNRFQEKMLNGKAQIYSWGWNADYPDPENFLFLLYGPNSKVKVKGENASNYENTEFDKLFTRMKGLPNGPERQAVIDQMVGILRRDAPWVWGFYPKSFSLHHAWYGNALPHLMANNTLKYKRIDAQLRAASRSAWNHPVTWPLWTALIILLASIVPAWISFRRRERSAAR